MTVITHGQDRAGRAAGWLIDVHGAAAGYLFALAGLAAVAITVSRRARLGSAAGTPQDRLAACR